LLTASRGAQKILGLAQSATTQNTNLQEFLRVCSKACGHEGGAVPWKAADGRTYALAAVFVPAVGPNTMAVRFEPLDQVDQEAHDIALAHAAGLSDREAQVFALMAKGLGNKEIGGALHISPATARTHVEHIIVRLQVSGRIEAINAVRGRPHALAEHA
jgi:DNA-binding CsgD family transcriptional regulator